MQNLSATLMEFMIDIQGFKTTLNKFVFKKISMIDLVKNVSPIMYLFEPSQDFNFLERRFNMRKQLDDLYSSQDSIARLGCSL